MRQGYFSPKMILSIIYFFFFISHLFKPRTKHVESRKLSHVEKCQNICSMCILRMKLWRTTIGCIWVAIEISWYPTKYWPASKCTINSIWILIWIYSNIAWTKQKGIWVGFILIWTVPSDWSKSTKNKSIGFKYG